jgi:hypothetical protein
MDLSQKIVEEIKFDSHKDLFSYFLYDSNPFLRDYIFRGIGTEKHELIPSALRENCQQELWTWIARQTPPKIDAEFEQHQLEINLLQKFYRTANKYGLKIPASSLFDNNPRIPGIMNLFHNTRTTKWIPQELFDLACLAQHYSVPTRLLDWSFDFMTALFFAVMDGLKHYNETDNAVVWALSDDLEYMRPDIPLKYIVPHYSGNPNIHAQSGILTLWQMKLANDNKNLSPINRKSLDVLITEYFKTSTQISSSPIFYKFIIPHGQLRLTLKVLNNMGYNEARIFPGYEGVVKYMQNKKFRM